MSALCRLLDVVCTMAVLALVALSVQAGALLTDIAWATFGLICVRILLGTLHIKSLDRRIAQNRKMVA